ncbi:MAG: thioredoxin [Oscillospiraceae bacterium]|nr:thioredoxin [Oscillospiraceae bacterium]
MSIKVNSANFDEIVLNSDKPVLVDFWATWCGPCKMIAPVIEELAEEYADRLVVTKLDVDQAPDIAGRYGVMSIPTLLVFENGKEAKRTVGFQSKDRLKAWLGL